MNRHRCGSENPFIQRVPSFRSVKKALRKRRQKQQEAYYKKKKEEEEFYKKKIQQDYEEYYNKKNIVIGCNASPPAVQEDLLDRQNECRQEIEIAQQFSDGKVAEMITNIDTKMQDQITTSVAQLDEEYWMNWDIIDTAIAPPPPPPPPIARISKRAYKKRLNVCIYASELAAVIGKGRFSTAEAVFQRLIKEHLPEMFVNVSAATSRVALDAELRNALCEKSGGGDIEEHCNTRGATHLLERQARLAEIVHSSKDLTANEKQSLASSLRRTSNCRYGIDAEEGTANALKQILGTGELLDRSNITQRLHFLDTEHARFCITGRVDGIHRDANGKQTVIEIKNRVKRLFYTREKEKEKENQNAQHQPETVSLGNTNSGNTWASEHIQVQAYLELLGLERGLLVEQHGRAANIVEVHRDRALFASIGRAVTEFARKFDKLLGREK